MWCEFDDGVQRLVKWHRSGPKSLYKFSHGPKTCFNELISARLGLLVGAPVLRASVVFVPNEIISKDDWDRGALPGLHCGLTRVEGRDIPGKDSTGVPINVDLGSVVNQNELGIAAVFLAWLQIEDHAMDISSGDVPTYDNGVFLQRVESGERYILLDLEHAFATPEWTWATLRPSRDPFVLPRHLKEHLEALGADQLSELFQRLERIDEANIAECFEEYPSEWCGAVDREQARSWTFERARWLARWFRLDGYAIRIDDYPSRRYP